jgi:hypothetical protein
MRRIHPAIHCFGHVHEYRGRISDDTNYFNCAATPFTFPGSTGAPLYPLTFDDKLWSFVTPATVAAKIPEGPKSTDNRLTSWFEARGRIDI